MFEMIMKMNEIVTKFLLNEDKFKLALHLREDLVIELVDRSINIAKGS